MVNLAREKLWGDLGRFAEMWGETGGISSTAGITGPRVARANLRVVAGLSGLVPTTLFKNLVKICLKMVNCVGEFALCFDHF